MSRAEAFELAQRIRSCRKVVLDRLSSGALGVAEVLDSSDPLVGSIKVVAVVESLPGLGKVAARRVLGDMNIRGGCKICDLDPARRRTLLDYLES